MSQNHLCLRAPGQHVDHLVAPHPIIMIARQPALRMALLVILPDVILVRRKDPRARLRHVDLQDAEARRVARRMVHDQTLRDLEEIA